MNYSFTCKKCGHTFMSNDKAEVKQAKQEHRPKYGTTLEGKQQIISGGCQWEPALHDGSRVLVFQRASLRNKEKENFSNAMSLYEKAKSALTGNNKTDEEWQNVTPAA
jgi:hypothetical protein